MNETYIKYSNTTKNNILFIDVSASCRKPSLGPISGTSCQYVKACPIHGSIGSSPRLDSCCQSYWSISPPLWVCQLCLILDQSPWCSPSLSHYTWLSLQFANMICNCRFVADTGCPGLFWPSKDSCDAIHFFTMFFYSCSHWPSFLQRRQ